LAPDWPIRAATAAMNLSTDAPLALIAKGVVFAASASARAESVLGGVRLREAQARCPGLIVLDHDPARDARAFEPIVAAIEELTPGVQLVRPGVCAVRVRGAANYYGGERAAALTLLGRMDELGAGGARAGVADGIFTADQAARLAGLVAGSVAGGSAGEPAASQSRFSPMQLVPAGESARFLAPLPVSLLDDPALVTLLARLGITTLGEFAALGAADVAARFGAQGARLHALAGGGDSKRFDPRTPPLELAVTIDFEPALDRVDQVAFGVRASAERFIDSLTAARLVGTAIRVELWADAGYAASVEQSGATEFSERVWSHPRSFTAADVVDRVRWQLGSAAEPALSSGVVRVRISPESVDAIGNHETGLWGGGPDERIHHGLSRVQSMLGHGAVLVPAVGGGRSLAARQRYVAWGDPAVDLTSAKQPWPGQLPAPLPGTVFATRHPVHVFSTDGQPVSVTERGRLSAAPGVFSASGTQPRAVTAWAGPWPVDERWWVRAANADAVARASTSAAASQSRTWRFQLVDATGCAWLLALDSGGWWAEARYD
jgi:protein ImuB